MWDFIIQKLKWKTTVTKTQFYELNPEIGNTDLKPQENEIGFGSSGFNFGLNQISSHFFPLVTIADK